MTTTRLEWNGMQIRVVRGYGELALHYELWVAETHIGKLWKYVRAAGAMPVGSAQLEAFRIAEGIPLYGVDMVEKDLPQETSQTRTLHFNKGCYLGQEIVERIRSRGNVHRHLRKMELTGPVPASGTELKLQDGKAAGHITSVAELVLGGRKRIVALGVVRAEGELSKEPLQYADGSNAGTARLLNAARVS
jgi:folate-binding protein YgfZ